MTIRRFLLGLGSFLLLSTGWCQEDFPFRLQLQHRGEEVNDVAFDPDSSLMATAPLAGKLRLWDSRAARILWVKDLPGTLVNPVGFTRDHAVVVIETRKVEKPFRWGFELGNQARQFVVVYDAESGNLLAEHELPLFPETVWDYEDQRRPFEKGSICLESLPEQGAGPSQVRVLDVLTGVARTEDAAPFRELSRLKEGGVNTHEGRRESASLDVIGATGGSKIRVTLEGATRRLSAVRDGQPLWADPLLPNATGFLSFGGVPGDRSGRLLWWHSQPDLGHGPFAILETETGRAVFIHKRRVQESPRLFLRPGTDECWVSTVPAKEGYENNSATVFARVPLDGSDRMVAAPFPGTLQQADAVEIFHDRYLVSANTSGPQAIWCWDLATLRLLWWRPSTRGGGHLRLEEDLVVASWDTDQNTDAVELLSGRPSKRRPPWRGADWSEKESSLLERGRKPLESGGLKYADSWFRFPDGSTARLQAFTDSGGLAVFSTPEGETFLWNVASKARVNLTVIAGEKVEWIAWSPDGYFEASPGGGGLVCAIDKTEPYPIDQFALRFNRPDRLLERLGTGDPALLASLREVQQRRLAKAGATGMGGNEGAFGLPLTRLLEAKAQDGQASLSVSVSDPAGSLKAVHIYANDVPVYGRQGRPVSGAGAEMTLEFSLGAGPNKIEVSCLSADGRESPRVLARLDGGIPRDKPALYFLGLGSANYEDKRVRDLDFTVKDARDLAALFGSLGAHYREVRTLVMADGELTGNWEEKPRQLLANARPDDLFVFFLSGHGVQENGIYYYLPTRVNLDRLSETGIPFSRLEALLEELPARRRLLLIDTCESGEAAGPLATFSDQSGLGRGVRARAVRVAPRETPTAPVVLPRSLRGGFFFNDLFRRTGSVVFTACAGGECSFENPEIENGYFTEAILKAFSEATADANGDGQLGKGELADYVSRSVSQLARKEGCQQTPELERDNLEETLNFPASDQRGSLPGRYVEDGFGTHLWWTGAAPAKYALWRGEVDAEGYAFGQGTLHWGDQEEVSQGNSDSQSVERHTGVMVRGRFDGPTDSFFGGDHYHVWWEAGEPAEKTRVPESSGLSTFPPASVPPAMVALPPPQGPPMANPQTRTAGYMVTFDGRALIWNNSPKADDVASWTGPVDPEGFATGNGVLSWHKGQRFVTGYQGTMIRGKLEGRTLSIDADGTRSVRIWKNGKKQ